MKNTSIKYQKDLVKFLKIYISNNNLKTLLNSSKYDFSQSFVKGIIGVLGKSDNFNNFTKDLYAKKIKKQYSFETLEEKEIAEIYLSRYDLQSNLKISKKFKYFFKLTIYKILIFIITLFKKSLSKKKLKPFKSIAIYIFCNSDSLRAKKIKYKKYKNIYFNKFYFFKKIINLEFNKNYFFIDNFLPNNYLYIYKMWISFFLIQQSIINIKPKLIISFEGDHYDHENISLLSQDMKFKAVTIQAAADLEGFNKAGFHNMGYSQLLVWGDYYKKIYRKDNLNLKTRTVGNYFIEKKKKNSKKYIGVILQRKSYLTSDKEFDAFKLLVKWLCNNYEDKIIIRKHPLDLKDDYGINNLIDSKKIILHNPHKTLIGETLNQCSFIVTKFSSTVVEAASIGVIPIMFNEFPEYEKKIVSLKRYNPSLICSSIEKMKLTIKILYNDEIKAKKIKKDLIIKFKTHIKYNGKVSLKKVNLVIEYLLKKKD